jgi:hypothetical protein
MEGQHTEAQGAEGGRRFTKRSGYTVVYLEVVVGVVLAEESLPVLRFACFRGIGLVHLRRGELVHQLVPARHRGVLPKDAAQRLHDAQRGGPEGAQNEQARSAETLVPHSLRVVGVTGLGGRDTGRFLLLGALGGALGYGSGDEGVLQLLLQFLVVSDHLGPIDNPQCGKVKPW